jgi:CMP-N,N'-diacetyllegionaminic acid synthase
MTIDANSEFLTLIPARGGSKGIPGKNLRLLAGMPLIGWSIRQIIESKIATRLVVTTDDQEIANYSASMGAEVVERPIELAGDSATSESALIHAIHNIPQSESHSHVVFLQATSPIRFRGSIDQAVGQYQKSEKDSVVAVVPASPFLWTEDNSVVLPSYNINNRLRRQQFDVESGRFRETGSIYITGREALLRTSNRISGQVGLFKMAEVEGIDIDTELDFQIAEVLINNLRDSGDSTL